MRKCLLIVVLGLCSLSCLTVYASSCVADDLRYLGYSDEISQEAASGVNRTHLVRQMPPAKACEPSISEADALLQQLTELGHTRSLTPGHSINAFAVRERLDDFWNRMLPDSGYENVIPGTELRNSLKVRISEAVEAEGYTIKNLDLIDMPSVRGVPQLRAVVRVVKPLKTKHGYREIQSNLAQLKKICMSAGTIDGTQYLSELTTFVAENPRNQYFYEKTVLNP